MKILVEGAKDYASNIRKLLGRKPFSSAIENDARKIIMDVKIGGDRALCKFAMKFDGAQISPSSLRISEKEISEAQRRVSPELKEAIRAAKLNIANFAKKRIPKDWSYRPRRGVRLGEKFVPFDSVGAYIPGGKAPLVSTALHTIAIAKTAGVKRIVAVSPPGKDSKLLPEMIYAIKEAGADEIYRIGGVYAIAALAYGTESVGKVQKIVGPGNAYVTAAKKLVFGECSVDMIAGPSEIMILAEKGQNPDFIAADMLSQAEHGSGLEQAVLVSDDMDMIKSVAMSIKKQAKLLSRQEALQKVIANGVFLVKVADMSSALDLAELYAPEHLEIMAKNPRKLAEKIRAAGAVFIGKWTPEPLGDFCAGPSHVLPTGGAAKSFSGLRVEDFFRRISIMEYDRKALICDARTIAKFAETEGLDAHGKSASGRIE